MYNNPDIPGIARKLCVTLYKNIAMENLIALPSDLILCVSITKNLSSNKRGSLYENARKYWRVSSDKIKMITHVAAVANGEVVAVYPHPQWKKTTDPEWPGRWEFTSDTPNGDPTSPYLGKKCRMYYVIKYLG